MHGMHIAVAMAGYYLQRVITLINIVISNWPQGNTCSFGESLKIAEKNSRRSVYLFQQRNIAQVKVLIGEWNARKALMAECLQCGWKVKILNDETMSTKACCSF